MLICGVYNGRLVTEVPAPHSEMLVKSLSRLLLVAALLPTIANENALHPIIRSVRSTGCHLPKPACVSILLRAAGRLVSATEREGEREWSEGSIFLLSLFALIFYCIVLHSALAHL